MTTGEGGFVATLIILQDIRMTLASLRDWGRACYCNTVKPGNVTCGTACGHANEQLGSQRSPRNYLRSPLCV
jgi:hypothetical protein